MAVTSAGMDKVECFFLFVCSFVDVVKARTSALEKYCDISGGSLQYSKTTSEIKELSMLRGQHAEL